MTTTRREFLDRLSIGTVALGGIPLALGALPDALGAESLPQSSWDVSWARRVTGRARGLFDVPEVESGFGVWRASLWTGQYEEVLGIPAKETSTVLVLRHNAIILAMQQAFWDKYGIGMAHKVMHPLTGQPTDRNPALLGVSDGVQEPFSTWALDKFIARGGICLTCNLALQFEIVPLIQRVDGVTQQRADELARGWLVPGSILQPSGVFAVFRAQEVGAHYIRAS